MLNVWVLGLFIKPDIRESDMKVMLQADSNEEMNISPAKIGNLPCHHVIYNTAYDEAITMRVTPFYEI